MSYIKLDTVTNSHLVGAWKVKQRLTNSTNVSQLFSRCDRVEFQSNNTFSVITQDGQTRKGRWEIVRETEMIYNPQVKFHLTKKDCANSIITNFTYNDQDQYKLILYFDSGIELVLERGASLSEINPLKIAG